MRGKVLIVEDEPIVALDLKQELEMLGCEVLGVAESADEALVAAGVHRPDLALMDVRIVGSVDGIQTAGLLRAAYQIPVVFLTSYSAPRTGGTRPRRPSAACWRAPAWRAPRSAASASPARCTDW